MAILAVGALLISQCADEEEPADGAEENATTTTVETATGAPAAPATTTAGAPAAPEPLPPPTAEPVPQPPAPATSPPSASPSGPPPVAVGTMPDLEIAADGYAHAVFVARYFGGPIEGFSAAAADSGVATAGVSPPEMLLVAPVSNGATSITVTASGPGGTATQTFTVRVGAGPAPVDRPAAPPPPQPASDPAEEPDELPPPPPDQPDDDVLIPIESLEAVTPSDDLPVLDPSESSDPLPPPEEPLPEPPPPVEVTEAPSLSGSVPPQLVDLGATVTVEVGPYFTGVVEQWEVESSHPNQVVARISAPGVVAVRGASVGLSVVTVTATNSLGSVAQVVRVVVRAGDDSPPPDIAMLGDDAPRFTVALGGTAQVNLADYMPDGATGFSVSYDGSNPDGRIDVHVRGSVAAIRGVQVGKIVVTLTATLAGDRVTKPALVDVVPFSPG